MWEKIDHTLSIYRPQNYSNSRLATGQPSPDSADREAAEERMECKASLTRQVVDQLSSGVRLVRKTMTVVESFTDTACTPDGQPGR